MCFKEKIAMRLQFLSNKILAPNSKSIKVEKKKGRLYKKIRYCINKTTNKFISLPSFNLI